MASRKRVRPSRRSAHRSSNTRGQPNCREQQSLSLAEALALAAACLTFVVIFALALARGAPVLRPFGTPSRPVSDTVESQNSEPGSGRSLPIPGSTEFTCARPIVVDGDTLRCGQRRVRLASIDAPELPGHCRRGRVCTPGDPFASTDNLRRLVGDGRVECKAVDTDRYGRTVAFCYASGSNLSCAQVRAGAAVVRYGALSCS